MFKPVVCAYENCQKEFTPKNLHHRKFCSQKCNRDHFAVIQKERLAATKKPITPVKCSLVTCQNTYLPKSNRHIYCSTRCTLDARILKRQEIEKSRLDYGGKHKHNVVPHLQFLPGTKRSEHSEYLKSIDPTHLLAMINAFCNCIDSYGGVFMDENGDAIPAFDEEAERLGTCYMQACNLLRRPQKIEPDVRHLKDCVMCAGATSHTYEMKCHHVAAFCQECKHLAPITKCDKCITREESK